MSGKRIRKSLKKFARLFPHEEEVRLDADDYERLDQVVYSTSQIPPQPLHPLPTSEPTFTIPSFALDDENGGGLMEPPDESGLRRQWTAYELLMFYRSAGNAEIYKNAGAIQRHLFLDKEEADHSIDTIARWLEALKRCWVIEGLGKLEAAIGSNNLASAEDAFGRLESCDIEPVRDYALTRMAAYRAKQRQQPHEATPATVYPVKRR